MKKYIYIAFVSFVALSSCDYFHLKKTVDEGEVIAKVGVKKLYKNDLSQLFNKNMLHDDSLLIRNNYIENWAKKQIILQKATLNLSAEKEALFNKMVEKYREDLFINSYKEALVSQNIDTLVTDTAIQDFYTANQNIFRLNEELIQYRTIGFSTESGMNSKEIKKLFIDNSAQAKEQLLADELQYISLQLNDSVWFKYTELLKKFPILKTKKKAEIFKKNNFFVVTDSLNTHYFYIKTYLKRNDIAPLDYVRPMIRQMILHQKKLKYIKEIEAKLVDEAIQNNTYIKY